MTWTLGVDTGGTFTDLVAYDSQAGRLVTHKSASTPGAPGQALLDVIAGSAIPPAAIERLVHGTTVATNALVERRGGTVAYVTTAGFEDVLFIQRMNRKDHYDLEWVKPQPLVRSRRHCFGVHERTAADGTVLASVDPAELAALADAIRATAADAVAVNFLFSYVNPANERAVGEYLRAALPALPISLAHEVAPIWREYERGNTAVADAYLKPLMRRYVASLTERLGDRGGLATWTLMKSNGGIMSSAAAAERPVHTIMSGPAGGMIAAEHYARLCQCDHLVTFDMGGTSTDVGTLLDGQQRFTAAYEVEWGQPIAVPLLDVKSIGAGGGSIAWIDAGGMVHVGPRSAGARPGPACYGHGGDAPTVTDANLLLGYLDPDRFLGGRMQLSVEPARAVLATFGRQLGYSPEAAAAAIVSIANENMANAIRLVTIDVGRDPRAFSLLAFGGAGGLHAAAVAERCSIATVLVPPFPGLFSALGMLLADVRVDRTWNKLLTSDHATLEDVLAPVRALRARVAEDLRREGRGAIGTPRFAVTAGMRYLGQNYEHEVPVDEAALAAQGSPALHAAFHRTHETLYGYRMEQETIEIVHFTVIAIVPLPKAALPVVAAADPTPPLGSQRIALSDGRQADCPVVGRTHFVVGETRRGPFLVAEDDATTLIRPEDTVTRTMHDVLVIHVGGATRG